MRLYYAIPMFRRDEGCNDFITIPMSRMDRETVRLEYRILRRNGISVYNARTVIRRMLVIGTQYNSVIFDA